MSMLKVLLCVSGLLLVTGCSSMPLSTAPKFQLPVEKACLQQCVVNSCRMPEWIAKATEADRRAIELNCAIINSEDARQCASLHQECLRWATKETSRRIADS